MANYTGIEIVNAFSAEFRTSLPSEFLTLITALNLSVNITEKTDAGGSTEPVSGDITIPTASGSMPNWVLNSFIIF